jgi:hypothetical protein
VLELVALASANQTKTVLERAQAVLPIFALRAAPNFRMIRSMKRKESSLYGVATAQASVLAAMALSMALLCTTLRVNPL